MDLSAIISKISEVRDEICTLPVSHFAAFRQPSASEIKIMKFNQLKRFYPEAQPDLEIEDDDQDGYLNEDGLDDELYNDDDHGASDLDESTTEGINADSLMMSCAGGSSICAFQVAISDDIIEESDVTPSNAAELMTPTNLGAVPSGPSASASQDQVLTDLLDSADLPGLFDETASESFDLNPHEVVKGSLKVSPDL